MYIYTRLAAVAVAGGVAAHVSDVKAASTVQLVGLGIYVEDVLLLQLGLSVKCCKRDNGTRYYDNVCDDDDDS